MMRYFCGSVYLQCQPSTDVLYILLILTLFQSYKRSHFKRLIMINKIIFNFFFAKTFDYEFMPSLRIL